MARKSYSPQFKFQVVLESLTSDRTDTEIARTQELSRVHHGRKSERVVPVERETRKEKRAEETPEERAERLEQTRRKR